MTEDPNRQNELKKMTLCEACLGIQRNWRRAPGHAELEQGSNRQEDMRANRHSNHKHSLVGTTSYSCARCGTAWEYENNKANQLPSGQLFVSLPGVALAPLVTGVAGHERAKPLRRFFHSGLKMRGDVGIKSGCGGGN